MRFRLVEDVDRKLGSYMDDWRDLGENFEESKFPYVIMKYYLGIDDPDKNKELMDLIADSITTFSEDPKKNNFLAYLITLKTLKGLSNSDWEGFIVDNLEALKTRALGGEDLKHEWYYDVDTLNRPYKDFTYVINVANILNDDTKRTKYFTKESPTQVENIYEGGRVDVNGTIKEPGIGSNDHDTIYGMINDWTQKYGAKGSGKEEEEKFSIIDVMRSVPETRDEAIRYDNSGEYVSKLYQLSLTDKFRKYRLAQILLSKYLSEKGARNSLLKAKIVDKKTLESIFVALEEKAKGLGIQ